MKYLIFFCVVLLASANSLVASTENFTRTLSLGMKGSDVRELQKILNADIDTRITLSGAGSLGQETDYFGLATKRALIKFQEKYHGEILSPAGLTRGTGVFGAKTRSKANMIMASRNGFSENAKNSLSVPASQPVQDIVNNNKTSESKADVFVMFPSQYSGKSGTLITLHGAGFTSKDNIIYFGERYAVEKASSWNGQEISFKIPLMPKGIYYLSVKNANGESNKDQFFVVTDGITPEPKIESLSPSVVVRGSVVSIKGSGFTEKSNMIRTGAGVKTDVVSDTGTSVSFTIPSDFLVTISTSTPVSTKKTIFKFWVYVVNENGVSNGKSVDIEL